MLSLPFRRGESPLIRYALAKRTQICFVLISTVIAFAQAPDLSYQQRGPYKEGIRTMPSTYSRVDLLAARIDYAEPAAANARMYHAVFYIPQHLSDLHLIIREAEDIRYVYWLDRPQDSAWQPNHTNRFDWPTTIIQYLNYSDNHQLVLDDLGAVVRIGEVAQQSERVLPVALYSVQPPQQVDSYSFAFRPDGPARLTFEVFPENSRTAAAPTQFFDHAAADKTQWVKWSVANWKDGWYLIKISGYALAGNGAEVKQEVHFYHSRRLVQ